MKIVKRTLQYIEKRENGLRVAGAILFVLNFADASLVPMPAQTLLLVFLLMYPERSPKFFILSVIGTVSGSLAGYLAGYLIAGDTAGWFSHQINHVLTSIHSYQGSSLNGMRSADTMLSLKILFAASFTPLPYGIFAVTSGMAKLNLPGFIVVTGLGQSMKFFLITLVASKPGQFITGRIKFHLKSLTAILSICFILLLLPA
jgi:membrane protein YqaA with SNARE-associated domain